MNIIQYNHNDESVNLQGKFDLDELDRIRNELLAICMKKMTDDLKEAASKQKAFQGVTDGRIS